MGAPFAQFCCEGALLSNILSIFKKSHDRATQTSSRHGVAVPRVTFVSRDSEVAV